MLQRFSCISSLFKPACLKLCECLIRFRIPIPIFQKNAIQITLKHYGLLPKKIYNSEINKDLWQLPSKHLPTQSNNRNTRKRCEIRYVSLSIKILE